MNKLKIGFIGNFKPQFSTENDRKWSFEQLGHEVIPFQENETRADDLRLLMPELDLLLYSHTHDPSYRIVGLYDVFEEYKKAGKPTASVHLDLWRDLARWSDVGNEATWFAEYIFTPDNTGDWPAMVNHKYLMPGVIARDCNMARPNVSLYPHEIVFIGSRGYHPEYPERRMLIDFLKKTYGNRFAHYGNDGLQVVRGEALNVLLASAKIVVGDSCFANSPKPIKGYWSDRIPEITGRGGFLIHPKIAECPHKGVGWYEPNNTDDLKNKIEFFLENREEREVQRIVGHDWTKKNATYTKRAQEILDAIFIDRISPFE